MVIGSVRITPLFAWYDLWIGVYYDRRNRCLYVLPIPMVGLKIKFGCSEALMKALAKALLKDEGEL